MKAGGLGGNGSIPFVCILSVLFFAGGGVGHAIEPDSIHFKGHEAHPTRILAKFKEGKQTVAKGQKLAVQGAALDVREAFQLVPGLVVLDEPAKRIQKAGGANAPLTDKAKAIQLRDRIAALKNSGLFEYVEPDYLVHLDATPTDEAFVDGTLWGLKNTGQRGGQQGADIGAEQAWENTTGSSEVIVAVIDTGIRYTHRDLAPNMWRNPGEIPGNGIDDDRDGYVDNVFGINAITGSGDPMDDDGHGTHVAGTIGAVANDANRHVGVAWNVRLMGCKFLPGGKLSDEIKCIEFAISKGAKIINASYGCPCPSQAELDAIRSAQDHNVLFVAAAGNGGEDGIGDDNDSVPYFPTSYPLENIISVAAVDRMDALANFSNYGQAGVDLAAPGAEILSCWIGSDTDYKTIQGTSMAAPHVAGVAALVLSRNPGMSVGDLRRAILDSVVPIPSLAGKTVTGGRVNAFNALSATSDGDLELTIQPPPGSALVAGSVIPVVIQVSDTLAVENATVTATVSDGSNLIFENSGVEPDASAADESYATILRVPPFSTSVTLTVSVSAPGKNPLNQIVEYSIVAPPVNDDYEKRVALQGDEITVSGSNRNASRQPMEPQHAASGGGRSVWWTWTPAESGQVEVSTSGSAFDTLLAVYSGSQLPALNLVAASDDATLEGGASLARFDVGAGVSYQIAVDGFGGATGAIQLHLRRTSAGVPPANDRFAESENVIGSEVSVNRTSRNAARETGEPLHSGNEGGASIWFHWTAPAEGLAVISTIGSDFDTLLAVYTGTDISNLTEVTANDDDPGGGVTSRVLFNATAGHIYRIAVDGYEGDAGAVVFSLLLATAVTGPVNDLFENSIGIAGNSVVVSGSTISAGKEPGEPAHADNSGGASVWWHWTAPEDGVATITTAGSSYDTLLAVYTGLSLGTLNKIVANDDAPGASTSAVSFATVSGATYRIAVDGYRRFLFGTATGEVSLHLTLDTGRRPPNDDLTDATALSGSTVMASGSNIGATVEHFAEPFHAGNVGGHSVWWSWTAPQAAVMGIKTTGSDFDTLLAVYSGDQIANLTEIASNDQDSDGGVTSRLIFNAVAGATYLIAVDGRDGTVGNIQLEVRPVAAPEIGFGTEFEQIEGYDSAIPLAGQQGWSRFGSGGNGLVTGFFPNEGQHAFIGFTPPDSGDTSLLLRRPIAYVPDPDELVIFSAKIRVADSQSTFDRDTFHWIFLNLNEEFLFSLRLNNSTREIEYRLNDNVTRPTGFVFERGADYDLLIMMDFNNNQWFVQMNGEDLVSGAPITTTSVAANLGEVDAGWSLTTPGFAGDNYMLFDNFIVFLLRAWSAPEIVSQPQSQTITEGETISLAVTATGTPTVSYQWQLDGADIPDATFDTLSIAVAGPENAGRYSVIVENQAGSITSTEAVVIVKPLILTPANDNFANRIVIEGCSNVVFVATFGASRELGEPVHAGNIGGKSVWWTWRAPQSGTFLISTAGSDFDTMLAVYSGDDMAALSVVGASDDIQSRTRSASVRFDAIAGSGYQIAVDGYNADSGNVRLTVKPAPQLDFSAPTRLPSGEFQASFFGEPGVRYVIQVSSDLVHWVDLTTTVGQDGQLGYMDQEAAGKVRRFYRAVQEP